VPQTLQLPSAPQDRSTDYVATTITTQEREDDEEEKVEKEQAEEDGPNFTRSTLFSGHRNNEQRFV
jgi:hypothetical protein